MLLDLRPALLLPLCLILPACSGMREAAPASSAATTAPAAPSTASAEASPGTPPAGDVDPGLLKAGYRLQRRKGEVLYCRSEIITGQRIATQVCLTAAQIQTEKQNVTKARDVMRQGGNRCVPPACE